MATGRGWINQQHGEQVQKTKPGPASAQLCHRQPINHNKSSRNVYQFRKRCIPQLKSSRKPSDMQTLYLTSIPHEIIVKILSYLDPISLMSVGCVSKQFYELSKDNVLWYKIYKRSTKNAAHWKPDSMNVLEKTIGSTTITEKEIGYWKKHYMDELVAESGHRVNQIMKAAKYHSARGVTANLEKAVRMSGLTWVLTFKDVNGKETTIKQTGIAFRDKSVTVVWNSYSWPAFHSLTMVQLHGCTPVQTDKSLPRSKNMLRSLSLIAEYNLKDWPKCGRYIGEDQHIKLYCLDPGLIIALWKRDRDIAFVMGSLHSHQLLEKSFWGTTTSSYIFPPRVPLLDDIDPEYGLHGYQLHIDMYNGQNTYMSRTFSGLFCRKNYIKNGFLRITAIGLKNNRAHSPLLGKINFVWETFTFSGNIQNCLMMDVTVLDETESPFWCFSAPVQLRECECSETLYDFMGQSFYLEYKDSVGKVHVQLNWLKETEEHFIINLILYLSTEKVNSYYGTNYTDAPNEPGYE